MFLLSGFVASLIFAFSLGYEIIKYVVPQHGRESRAYCNNLNFIGDC